MGLHRTLVPFESSSWDIGYVQEPVFNLVGPLQNWIGPVLPFQPMGRFSDAHHVGGNLGVEVRRYRDPRRTGDGSSTHPARDTTNAHEVRHHEIACLLGKRLMHLP